MHSHKGKRDACIPIRKRKMKWKKNLFEVTKTSQISQGEILGNLLRPSRVNNFSDNQALHLLLNKWNNFIQTL